jgi:hypothetical protein
MTNSLEGLELMMKRVDGTLRSVEDTLQKSLTLQERFFDVLKSSVTQQEQTQAVIVRVLER